MTHHIHAKREIAVPADDLWKTVSQMTGMEHWYPGLIRESEVMDTERAQPKRHCIMQDGKELRERILLRDQATRTFVYAIDSHPLPAKNVVGTIRIDDLGNGKSHVVWAADMALDPASADQMKTLVLGMYEAGLGSLADFHKS